MAKFLALLCPALVAASADDDAFNFLVMGDWGGIGKPPYTTPEEVATAAGMGKVAGERSSRFAMALGDNFYSLGIRTDETDMRFEHTFENVFTSPNLMGDDYFRVLLGNHDHYGNVTAQVEYSNHSKRWRMDDLYWSFEETGPAYTGDLDRGLVAADTSATSTLVKFVMIDTVTLAGVGHQRDEVTGEYFTPHGDALPGRPRLRGQPVGVDRGADEGGLCRRLPHRGRPLPRVLHLRARANYRAGERHQAFVGQIQGDSIPQRPRPLPAAHRSGRRRLPHHRFRAREQPLHRAQGQNPRGQPALPHRGGRWPRRLRPDRSQRRGSGGAAHGQQRDGGVHGTPHPTALGGPRGPGVDGVMRPKRTAKSVCICYVACWFRIYLQVEAADFIQKVVIFVPTMAILIRCVDYSLFVGLTEFSSCNGNDDFAYPMRG